MIGKDASWVGFCIYIRWIAFFMCLKARGDFLVKSHLSLLYSSKAIVGNLKWLYALGMTKLSHNQILERPPERRAPTYFVRFVEKLIEDEEVLPYDLVKRLRGIVSSRSIYDF